MENIEIKSTGFAKNISVSFAGKYYFSERKKQNNEIINRFITII